MCIGLNGLTMGSVESSRIRKLALEKAKDFGFKGA